MDSGKKIGVVLFQLGGPDSLETVEPFLHNLFLDPDIIDFPFAKMARPALARLIAASRTRKVQKSYAAIGGKSPIVEWTHRQARALEEALRGSLDARVVVAMRYWHPLTEEAIQELAKDSYSQLILLPLYPQYSKTTTGSSFHEWQRRFPAHSFPNVAVKTIVDFHNDPGYISSVVEKINACLEKFPDPSDVHLIFSAHGVPVRVIQSGDPYQAQVEETARLVMQCGQRNRPYTVCYQSQVGSDRWLGPSIHEVIEQFGSAGAGNVLVVPISFVCDHLETLHELDVEVRQEAAAAGLGQFEMMPGLNDSPAFIRALAGLVKETAHGGISQ